MGHARALIESHGRRVALSIAQANAAISAAHDYWAGVLLAVFRLGFPPDEDESKPQR